jgi:hypothetical protein
MQQQQQQHESAPLPSMDGKNSQSPSQETTRRDVSEAKVPTEIKTNGQS